MRPIAARRASTDEESRHAPSARRPAPGQKRSLQPAAMREMNMGSLLRAIRVLGPRARVELAEYTGISPATVTKLVANLTEVEILTELADSHSLRMTGRPRVPVEFTPERRAVLALHFGDDRITGAALDLRGVVITERSVDYPDGVAGRSAQAGARLLARIAKSLPGSCQPVGVGITAVGLLDRDHGLVRRRDDRGWENVHLAQPVAEHLQLPTEFDRPVRGETMALLATDELARNLVHLNVGPLVEAAVVIDRQLHSGSYGEAGRVAHLPVTGSRGPECECGQTSCLGTVASDGAVLAAARAKHVIGDTEGYEELLARADAKDRTAVALLRNRARTVGRALALLADLVDPDRILLTGTAIEWPGFEAEVAQALTAAPGDHRVDVLRFGPGPVNPVVAAGMLFLDRYFDDPVRFEPDLQRRLSI